ncbi:MAG: hypothetical protein GF384_05140, partial [Elusimicrobia bacterium]|nr:hypothetical protein [Elusimicrobiota bacterium]
MLWLINNSYYPSFSKIHAQSYLAPPHAFIQQHNKRAAFNQALELSLDTYSKIWDETRRHAGYAHSIKYLGSEEMLDTIISDIVVTDDDISLIAQIVAFGKARVFLFWNELTDDEKRSLLDQLHELDIPLIENLTKDNIFHKPTFSYEMTHNSVSRPTVIERTTTDIQFSKTNFKDAFELGAEAFGQGFIAFLEVAGGSGTRLGYEEPKGMYPISPLKTIPDKDDNLVRKSLYQLRAESIKAIKHQYHKPIPWIIMTSDETDEGTRAFFKENDYFGIPYDESNPEKSEILFVKQRVFPLVTNTNEFVLKTKSSIHLGGAGHGDARDWVLGKTKVREWLAHHGIKYLALIQVDNALAIPDEVFLGLHIQSKDTLPKDWEHLSAIAVKKSDPRERVGMMINNRHTDSLSTGAVLEYHLVPHSLLYIPNTYIIDGAHIVFTETQPGKIEVLPKDQAYEWLEHQHYLRSSALEDATIKALSIEELKHKFKTLSELPSDLQEIFKPKARLWIEYGSINFHIWTLDTVIGKPELPIHVARDKKVDGVDETGKTKKIVCNKFEYMVFDGKPRHGSYIAQERYDCFAPVKEKMVNHVDNPERASQIMSIKNTRMLDRLNWEIADGNTIILKLEDLDKPKNGKDKEKKAIPEKDHRWVLQIIETGEYIGISPKGFHLTDEAIPCFIEFNPQLNEYTFTDINHRSNSFTGKDNCIEFEGTRYFFTADVHTGRVALTTRPQIDLSAAFAYPDGRWTLEKMGTDGSIGKGSRLYVSGNKTRIGSNFTLGDFAEFRLMVSDEFGNDIP